MRNLALSAAAAASFIGAVVAAPATSGSFNCLSMNVAGIPEILQSNDESGDKTTNTQTIGEKFSEYGYDFIHVQEDFNYHATLYEYDNHTYRTATSGGVVLGSGLNTLANYDWIDFTRITWDDCSNASEDDCLTPKGFTFMRARLDDGVYIDLYNMHTDAGTEDDDETARNSNLQQVMDYINTWSIGNVAIIFGDSNSRYTRTADNIRIFMNNGFSDSWVTEVEGGDPPAAGADAIVCDNPTLVNTCETVDKLFYRSNGFIELTNNGFYYDSLRFLSDNATTLTDHNPIRTEFSYSLNSTFRMSDFVGGPHGTWFSDFTTLRSLPSSPVVSTITLRGGSRLDSVAVTLSTGTTLTHGGTGGDASSLTFSSGEYITSAYLCQGEYDSHTRLFYAKFTTTLGNTVSAGKTTDDCYSFTAQSGYGLVGFHGQDGDEIDQLAIVWGKK
ncbi:Endonuclease/exonuclease/phosphatase [Dipodascopsis tothii]|uniref:Endonuclease/exonuclease/phosphatase n=1 Tax=Dipodascopsis tothii TaxID=44089 RepID=UPI0034CD1B70